MRTTDDAKAVAKAIRNVLADRNVTVSHSEALEIVARQFGYDNWNIMSARLEKPAGQPAFTPPIPIFRIFDEEKARASTSGSSNAGSIGSTASIPARRSIARFRAAGCSCTCPNTPETPAPEPRRSATWKASKPCRRR